jgi:hypothetical protein
LIGVISKESEAPIVSEVFQLLKIPYEFYAHDRYYDVVLLNQNRIPRTNSTLLTSYGCDKSQFDQVQGIHNHSKYRKAPGEYNGVNNLFRVPNL